MAHTPASQRAHALTHARGVRVPSRYGRTVIGALLGEQAGRTIEVANSFELALTAAGTLDRAYLVTKQAQCNVHA